MTALKWPSDVRTSHASFAAHQELRGEQRFEQMDRAPPLLKIAPAQNRSGSLCFRPESTQFRRVPDQPVWFRAFAHNLRRRDD
jgi:hypothetical protein